MIDDGSGSTENRESKGNYWESLEDKILNELQKSTPWNVITKRYHVSAKTVAKIKKNHSSPSSDDNKVSVRVFQLFELGEDPAKVTVELELSPEKVLGLYDLWLGMKERSGKLDGMYRKGYDDAMKIEHFTMPCSICGKPMLFESTDVEWLRIVCVKLRREFGSWCHTKCDR